jgi:two-component system sensor histidine kinase KdpD
MALGVTAASTALTLWVFGRDQLPDVVMTYLVGIMWVAVRYGLGASVFAAFLGVAAVDYFFVPPYFTFAIKNPRHGVTFAVMFLVAVVISWLADRVKAQAAAARARELEAERARREFETEQIRSSLLSSVSHEFRTPLAVIAGAASTLASGLAVDEAARRDLIETILEESESLNRLIRNLLDMTRLESGAVKLKKEWLPFEEVAGAALNRAESRLEGRDVRVNLPRDLPLVPFDGVLVEIALVNLLENAAKYGRDPIELQARLGPGELVVEVSDSGPGLPRGHEQLVFEKFHRASTDGGKGGVGLGLAICRAIVSAHGGKISVRTRDSSGASFRFTLPIEGDPPVLDLAEPIEGPS